MVCVKGSGLDLATCLLICVYILHGTVAAYDVREFSIPRVGKMKENTIQEKAIAFLKKSLDSSADQISD